MNAKIAYTAHSTPKNILSNFDLEKLVDTSDSWIKSRTGIKQRYIVENGEASSHISTKSYENESVLLDSVLDGSEPKSGQNRDNGRLE